MIWRGIEGDTAEDRSKLMKMLAERVLGRKVEVRRVEERIGGGKGLLLVIMKKELDRDALLERREEIVRRWGVLIDEDLTRDERKLKWRIKEKARLEGKRGRRVEFDSGGIWIKGKEWKWSEEEGRWIESEGEERREGE